MAGPNFTLRPFSLPELEGLRATVVAGAGGPARDARYCPSYWALLCSRGASSSGERLEVGGERFVMKREVMGSSGARRHGLRHALLRLHPPRIAELRFLDWLRERLFHVPTAVVAVTLWRGWQPVRQMLVTRELVGARPLGEAWGTASEGERDAWARELGRELGRMHALRFLHADLYPRNVLVTEPPSPSDSPALDGSGLGRADLGNDPGYGRRVAWIDAWAGGPTAWRRGRFATLERDLGAFFSVATDWMEIDHQRSLLEAYVGARSANGRAIENVEGWRCRLASARLAQWKRLRDAPARLRGRPLPPREWQPPSLSFLGSKPGC